MKRKPARSLGEDAREISRRLSAQRVKLNQLWVKTCIEIGRCRDRQWRYERKIKSLDSSPKRAFLRMELQKKVAGCETTFKDLTDLKDKVDAQLEELRVLEDDIQEENVREMLELAQQIENKVNELYASIEMHRGPDD